MSFPRTLVSDRRGSWLLMVVVPPDGDGGWAAEVEHEAGAEHALPRVLVPLALPPVIHS